MKNLLVYLVYGPDPAYHAEARFSILSALYRSTQRDFTISVYTDAPQQYAGLPVEVQMLAADTLQQWYGAQRYHHRSKLCLLQQVVPLADKTVFIDTDTFFLRDPSLLFAAVNDHTCLADELYRSQLPAAWAGDGVVSALLAQAGINPQDIPVINSGLFGIARANSRVPDLALALCDAVYPASQRSLTTEQLVLGMAAGTCTQLVADDGIIKHYWSRKQLFRAKATAFLARHGAQWDTAAARNDFRRVTPVLPKPPVLVRTLVKLASLRLPRRERQLLLELFYARYPYANPFDRACHAVWREKAIGNFTSKTLPADRERLSLPDSTVARILLGKDGLQQASDRLRTAVAEPRT